MVHDYKVKGMTCGSCEKKVSNLLRAIPGVADVKVDRELEKVSLTMSRHIENKELKKALENSGYSLEEETSNHSGPLPDTSQTEISYKPIYLIFGYLTAATILLQFTGDGFNLHEWFRHFMAGFFFVFSFFKLLDINAFASSYSSYDIIAKRINAYGYIYPFIELALGLGFLIPQWHTAVNASALIVMSVSIVGVIQSMMQKRTIQCACLGAVFKLPLSKITLFEDGLMIVMSVASLTLINNQL